jgi:ferritin-like metal-binding protein YciE
MAEIRDPKQLFVHKLGAAYTMEKTVLEMLERLQAETQSVELRDQFRHHHDETKQQISNLELVFTDLGSEPQTLPCPAIEGLKKEAEAMIKLTDDQLADSVLLAAAADTEHHEISVYEGLIIKAESMGKDESVRLLQRNLEQEQQTLEVVKKASRRAAEQLAYQAT